MRIKASPPRQTRRPRLRGWIGKLLAGLILCALLAAAFVAGILVHKKKIIGDYVCCSQFNKGRTALAIIWYAKDTGEALANWVAIPFRNHPEPIHVHIKHKHLQKPKV